MAELSCFALMSFWTVIILSIASFQLSQSRSDNGFLLDLRYIPIAMLCFSHYRTFSSSNGSVRPSVICISVGTQRRNIAPF